MDDKLLTPEQVADYLQVSGKAVRDWLRDGRLKGVKIGKLWRVRRADLLAFVEQQSQQ